MTYTENILKEEMISILDQRPADQLLRERVEANNEIDYDQFHS